MPGESLQINMVQVDGFAIYNACCEQRKGCNNLT